MFINLHNHTNFSFLDGLSTIDSMVARAKEMMQNALAITDHGGMYGMLDFYKKCIAGGIKPIIGCEIYVTKDSSIKARKELDKLAKEDAGWLPYSTINLKGKLKKPEIVWNRGCHLVLLAKNDDGLKNLFKIVSYANTDGFYYKPMADMNILRKHSKGIVAMSACLGGEIPQLILKDDYDAAKALALQYKEIFEDYYLELQPSKLAEQLKVNMILKQISEQTGIPLVCTADAHYVRAEDWETHDVLLAMQTGETLESQTRLRFPDRVYFLHTEEEMLEAGMPVEAIENTVKIAEMCNVTIETNAMRAPIFPDTKDAVKDLSDICRAELMSKFMAKGFDFTEYTKRLDYELDVINKKGLSDYFLIVRDYINDAVSKGIFVGPGRGSGAGSLVAHLSGITKLDPIKHGLYFERFLNPERQSYPDIDVDFEKARRDEIIEYIMEKYGRDHVCHVGTYAFLGPKSALKDVARVLGIPMREINAITTILPVDPNNDTTLADILNDPKCDPRIKEASQKMPRLFELAMTFEGVPRQTGVGASGVIISPVPIADLFPIAYGSSSESSNDDDVIVAQMDTKQLESIGLIKFDILGLRTLSVIKDTLAAVENITGKKVDIWEQSDDSEYSDPDAYAIAAAGDADGIFQLESSGMRQVIKDLKMKDFAALTATIALYRPGPMDLIPDYISRYRGFTPVTYIVPEAEDILRETYGVIVYQEQVMTMAIKLAGYTPGQADALRKAMGKKDKPLMKKQIRILIDGDPSQNIGGFVKRGMDPEIAEKLGAQIEAFGEYAFNKAHAASYAVISYATAWLKAHYTRQYTAAQLSSIVSNGGKKKDNLQQYVDNFKSRGYRVVGPDINLSDYDFKVEGTNVRFGFSVIRDFGEAVKDVVINNQPFVSLEDVVNRIYINKEDGASNLNARQINALIFSGALDSLAPDMDRKQIYSKIRQLRYNTDVSFEDDTIKVGQESIELSAPDVLPMLEETYLGMPMALDVLSKYGEDPYLPEVPFKKEVTAHGVLQSAKAIKTRDDKDMAFLSIRFTCGKVDAAMFGEEFVKYFAKLEVGNIYRFTLYKTLRNGADSYCVRKIVKAA